jgi:hypothetical protein
MEENKAGNDVDDDENDDDEPFIGPWRERPTGGKVYDDDVYWTEQLGKPGHQTLLETHPIVVDWSWDLKEETPETLQQDEDDKDPNRSLVDVIAMMEAALAAAQRIHDGKPRDGDLRLVARYHNHLEHMNRQREDDDAGVKK